MGSASPRSANSTTSATGEKSSAEEFNIDLRSPTVAAILAWLWPGAGHFYQRRYGKGMLFMVCILSTWFFGLALGEGHTVYASNRMIGRRLVYGCQLAVGLPATPALVQALKVRQNQPVLWNGFMAPPNEEFGADELSDWTYRYGAAYDMGVLYTMVAGLLNVLVIFDAYGGPMLPAVENDKKRKPPSNGDDSESSVDTKPS